MKKSQKKGLEFSKNVFTWISGILHILNIGVGPWKMIKHAQSFCCKQDDFSFFWSFSTRSVSQQIIEFNFLTHWVIECRDRKFFFAHTCDWMIEIACSLLTWLLTDILQSRQKFSVSFYNFCLNDLELLKVQDK